MAGLVERHTQKHASTQHGVYYYSSRTRRLWTASGSLGLVTDRRIEGNSAMFRKMLAFAVLLFPLAYLPGCTQMAQKNTDQKAASEVRAAIDRHISYFATAPEFEAIRGRIYLARDVRETPLAMLGIDEKPNEDQKKALEAYQSYMSGTFYPEFERISQTYYPGLLPIFQAQRAAMYALLADLYVGQITYGGFNRKRVDIANETIAALQRRSQELQELNQRQAQAASSAALQSFQTYLLGQQLLNQQFQPARIAPFTCAQLGKTTNCY